MQDYEKNNIQFRQIVNIDDELINITSNWMYNWWGKKCGYTFEEIKCYMKHSIQKDKLPRTYGLFLEEKIIGMYQFVYDDLSIRPDIYPWLANVYIDEKHRNKGFGRILLENVRKTAQECVNFNEIYLYTSNIGLYEKFEWEYVSDIDTYSKTPRIQRLYKLNLKD